ncbi:zinc-binding dehydrogenase [Mycolicibacterium komossense]|uniref:Zinc-binding dehydrogenase n=1 Tax=Mycolicibacterium komossense TaxID=1779 RepID=A0ABT3C9T9_9MYCO|nr:zinc-binding dehydrogenase [Mycolicibacterium komossense]
MSGDQRNQQVDQHGVGIAQDAEHRQVDRCDGSLIRWAGRGGDGFAVEELHPRLDRHEYNLSEINAAHEAVETGTAAGKVVMAMS